MTNSKKVEELGWELGKELTKAEPMAVLVMDMPKSCIGMSYKCPLCSYRQGALNYYCTATGDINKGRGIENYKERPDWCPLSPDYKLYVDVYDVEKHNQEIDDWLTEGSCSSIGEVFTQIWNECVDRMLGEEEE